MKKEEIERRAKETLKKLGKNGRCCSENLQIELYGNRYVLLSTRYFPYELKKDMEELFGGVGDFVLYRGGKRIGKRLVREYANSVNDDISMYDVLAAVGWYFGWAIGDSFKKGDNYRTILYDSFEADSYIENEGKGDKPVCHFMRGVLTGIVEEIEKSKYEGKEVKCKAQGYEYCEFLIERKE